MENLMPLIVVVGVIVLILGFLLSGVVNRKDRVALDLYTGKFKDTLVKGKKYLQLNFSSPKDFAVTVYVGEDAGVVSHLSSNFFRPNIVLSQLNIANEGWRQDFNRMADYWKVPQLQHSQDHALFLLFHEYRHCSKQSSLDDYHPIEVNEQTKKLVPSYHLQPRESDADWFGLTQVEKYRQLRAVGLV